MFSKQCMFGKLRYVITIGVGPFKGTAERRMLLKEGCELSLLGLGSAKWNLSLTKQQLRASHNRLASLRRLMTSSN